MTFNYQILTSKNYELFNNNNEARWVLKIHSIKFKILLKF